MLVLCLPLPVRVLTSFSTSTISIDAFVGEAAVVSELGDLCPPPIAICCFTLSQMPTPPGGDPRREDTGDGLCPAGMVGSAMDALVASWMAVGSRGKASFMWMDGWSEGSGVAAPLSEGVSSTRLPT